jgi:hypothetical protein
MMDRIFDWYPASTDTTEGVNLSSDDVEDFDEILDALNKLSNA